MRRCICYKNILAREKGEYGLFYLYSFIYISGNSKEGAGKTGLFRAFLTHAYKYMYILLRIMAYLLNAVYFPVIHK